MTPTSNFFSILLAVVVVVAGVFFVDPTPLFSPFPASANHLGPGATPFPTFAPIPRLPYGAFIPERRTDPPPLRALGQMWLTRPDPEAPSGVTLWSDALRIVSSTFGIAVMHFNERDGRVVPDFAADSPIMRGCRHTIDLVALRNTAGQATEAVK